MMKKKIVLSIITMVIIGLLISSMTTSILAKNISVNTDNDSGTRNLEALLNQRTITKSDILLTTDTFVDSSTEQMTRVSGSMKQSISTRVEQKQIERVLPPPIDIGKKEHPAVCLEPNGDGVVAYEFYDQGGNPEYACYFEGFINWGEWWGTEDWPIYWVDNDQNPIRYSYPSLHFRGNKSDGCYSFIGTANDGYYDRGYSGYTLGGATTHIEINCDVSINTSFYNVYWDWHIYGWNMADDLHPEGKSRFPHAESAPAYYREGDSSTDWAWGINSYIFDTTYTYSGMEDNHYQTDGGFVNYQTSEDEYATISWYEEVGECLSTDCIIDNHADLFADPDVFSYPFGDWNWTDYSDKINWSVPGRDMDYMPYVAYSIFDPLNRTSGLHSIFIRVDDWLGMSPFDELSGGYYAGGGWFIDNELYSLEYPTIVCDKGQLIIAFEVVYDEFTRGLEIWRTGDGYPGNLVKVAEIIPDSNQEFRWPEIIQVQEETFLGKLYYNDGIYMFITYDGGQTWDGLYTYYYNEEAPVTNTPRCWDTSEYGILTFWMTDSENPWEWLMYRWDSVKYGCYAYYDEIGGEPAPLNEFTIENIQKGNHTLVGTIDKDQGNYGWRFLLYGFEIWGPPDPAVLRLIAKDSFESVGILDQEIISIDVHDHVIALPIVVDIHYRDLKEFPYYVSNVDSGAAVATMMLDYLFWNRSLHPRPLQLFDQQTLFDTYAGGDSFDASELSNALVSELRAGDIEPYFFMPETFSTSDAALRNICTWVDFPIDFFNGEGVGHWYRIFPIMGYPNHVPVAVPTNGDWTHWMAIRGIHTSANTWYWHEPPPTYTIFGFWVNDPNSSKIDSFGGNSYKTVDVFLDKYYKPIGGLYYTLMDPPEIDGVDIADALNANTQVGHAPAQFTKQDAKIVQRAKTSLGPNIAGNLKASHAARNAANEVLKADSVLSPIFNHAVAGKVTYTQDTIIVEFNNRNDGVRFQVVIGSVFGELQEINLL
ncbi:MAG: hypothetical protein V1726_01370 [Methanobacteriota archaeon]